MSALQSYLGGRWVAGAGNGAPLHDPTSEAELARASTEGLDFGAALHHAREVGGPALRELTFAQRAELIGRVSKALHEHREELLDLATQNGGNTRSDGKFDIDGATSTLAYYAKVGAELGDRRLLADGELTPLGRSPRLVGGHWLTSRHGAAVLINAFNFPAWGFAEKAAVAWLAGMPVVTKPATSTALVAHRMAQIIVAADIVPAGAFSFICGGAGDLLDHLDWQDVVAFTGSSDTGLAIRGHRRVLGRGVRVNVEADSLNAAVLGPDVEPGSDTHDLFLREVARDVTQKAGQKCTAIRRVFVPKGRGASVRDALRDELRTVKTGAPSQKGVTVGPLATASQLRAVHGELDRLRPEAEVVLGGERGTLTGIENERGWFLSPTLLVCADADNARAVHEREPFGPVATVMGYDGSAAHAARLLARGGGSLVSSIYSDDADFARAMVGAAAPVLGRMHLGSAKVAEHSPGPGTVLPTLQHGGPGRAGGGAELAGLRALHLYMQRTAVQGYAPLLEKLG